MRGRAGEESPPACPFPLTGGSHTVLIITAAREYVTNTGFKAPGQTGAHPSGLGSGNLDFNKLF